MQRTLCFDDVLMVPQYSEIESRKNVSLCVSGFDDSEARLTKDHPILECPIIGSPMDTVISPTAASVIQDFGGLGVLHRYCTIVDAVKSFKDTVEKCPGHPFPNVMIAVGATGDYLERAQALYEAGCRAFCVDVAHGHHASVKSALKQLRSKFGKEVHIMTGNVATLDAFNDLADWGSDSIRVGVGGGSMCSTRIRTGHGIPTLQSVVDCAKSDRDVFIVAGFGLRRGREDRLGQFAGFLQPGRERDAADGLGLLIFLPARAGEVAAHDALDRQHPQLLAEHRAAAQLGRDP